ncbi:RNA-binding protein 33-like, partial [Arachis ipaensis]|uniref:RNA-binding protein 33-like n=1 Tax=Arachis ipaensis TaxID=130454 RepID=UPI000A2B555C
HFQAQPQPQHFQGQVRSPPQPQLQSPPQHFQAPPQQQRFQNQQIQYLGSYPPPPWASTPGYPNYQNHLSPTNLFSNPQANTTGPFTFPSNGAESAVGANFGQRSPGSTGSGQRPFIPSYRLFEDLNVFGNTDGRVKMTGSGTSSGMSGTMGPGMVGGRK